MALQIVVLVLRQKNAPIMAHAGVERVREMAGSSAIGIASRKVVLSGYSNYVVRGICAWNMSTVAETRICH